MQGRHRPPAEHQLGLAHVAPNGAGPDLAALGLGRGGIDGAVGRGPVAVRGARERQRLVGIDVAHDGDDGPLRDVSRAVVGPEIVAGESGELFLVADAPAADAVPVEHHLVQRLVGDGARRVELALGLLDDDLELARQLAGVDDRVAERVGLDVERGRRARRPGAR